jgi:hypothetical protein
MASAHAGAEDFRDMRDFSKQHNFMNDSFGTSAPPHSNEYVDRYSATSEREPFDDSTRWVQNGFPREDKRYAGQRNGANEPKRQKLDGNGNDLSPGISSKNG